jgi:hypothetical protein
MVVSPVSTSAGVKSLIMSDHRGIGTTTTIQASSRGDGPPLIWWRPLATYDSICERLNERETTAEPGNRLLLGGHTCALLSR